MTALKVWWWRWKYPHDLNFGDELTAPLLERLTGRPVVWAPLEQADLVGAGSVLQNIMRSKRTSMPVAWGTGLIRPYEGVIPQGFRPAAVRGRLSREIFTGEQDLEMALGDPGLLSNLLIDGTVKKKHALGVVPHYKDVDDETFAALSRLSGVRRIDVAWTPEEVAREIASCEVIISSSMHGLIFADALGVPNLHLQVSDKLVGGSFKFRDYSSAFTGERYQPPIQPEDVRDRSLSDVVALVRSRYRDPGGLEDLQRRLIEALPLDTSGR